MRKYVVFKRSDWEAHEDQPGCIPMELEIEDAVVIRRQDVFAPPALDAYANAITVALQLDPESPYNDWGQSLQRIADYFHEQAQLAWETNRKVPD